MINRTRKGDDLLPTSSSGSPPGPSQSSGSILSTMIAFGLVYFVFASTGSAQTTVGRETINVDHKGGSNNNPRFSQLVYPSPLLRLKKDNDNLRSALLRAGGDARASKVDTLPPQQQQQQQQQQQPQEKTDPPIAPPSSSDSTTAFVDSAFTITHTATKNVLIIDTENWLATASSLEPLERKTFLFEGLGLDDLNTFAIKHPSKNTYLTLRPPNDRIGWVFTSDCASPKTDKSCQFQIHEGSYIFNLESQGYVNVVNGKAVRGHGVNNSAGPAKKTEMSKFSFDPVDDSVVKAEAAAAERAIRVMKYMDSPTEQEYIERIKKLPQSSEKRVISFGLYGSNPKYTVGAIRNAELRDTYFPGWVVRFYVDGTVPADIVDRLRDLECEIVEMDKYKGGAAGMFWRFLVADDKTVDRWIVRDSDSRLNARDRFAVEDWIESGKSIHSVRDHVNHNRPLNGGMWGGVKGIVEVESEVAGWKNLDAYMQDLYFLNDVIWPRVKDDQISHDAYNCKGYPNAHPFPTRRDDNYQHVGQVFNEFDAPRMDDIDSFIRGKQNPVECRPTDHQEWMYG